MSLVGTRPPTLDEWEKYELHHRARLAIKPGITGMWQVSGRSDITDFEEVVKLDMPSIYQLSNIAVLPSMWDEPAGMTMVEAVASGLPLITTNSGGIPEYIPNKLAVILNRDDKLVENITENILNLKQNGWEEDQHSLNQFRSEMCLRHYYQEFSNIINKR